VISSTPGKYVWAELTGAGEVTTTSAVPPPNVGVGDFEDDGLFVGEIVGLFVGRLVGFFVAATYGHGHLEGVNVLS